MPSIFISGAASGIGRALLYSYIQDPSTTIIALDRSFKHKSTAEAFPDLPHHVHSRIQVHTIDITKTEEITALGKRLDHDEVPLDLVVHSAGVRGLVPEVPIHEYSDVAKTETLEVMTVETMQHTLTINTVGTFVLLRALLPALQRSSAMRPGSMPKVIVMGSRMGSVGGNAAGGGYAYRASKAALNAIVKSMSVDVPGVIFMIVHPGRIESKLVPIKEDNAMSAEEAVKDLVPLIEQLQKRDSGRLCDRFNVDIPW